MKPRFVISPLFIPAAIIFIFSLAFYMAWFFRVPTYAETNAKAASEVKSENARTASFEIDGVVCYGTSGTLAKWVKELPGILSVTAYTSDRYVEVGYDSSKTGVDDIIMSVEREVTADGAKIKPFSIMRYRESAGGEWVVLRTRKKTEVDEL